jgi:glycosyltransferase involved in cell wall biosynthesis
MHIGIDGLLLHGSYSGVEQAIYHLLRELSVDGGPHRYTVYVTDDFREDHLSRPGLEFRRTGLWGHQKLRRAVWTQTGLAGRARSDGIDLFHGAGYILPSGWRGPAVVTVFDTIALTHPHLCTASNAAYYRAFLPRTCQRASAVIVPSAAARRAISDSLGVPDERIHVAPLGVGEEFVKGVPQQRLQEAMARYQVSRPYLLCVGNIEPKKNLAVTIEGFAHARRRGALPHTLVLAGGKSWKSRDVERAIGQLPPDWITRTGYVAAEDLPLLYAGADALLFWSLIEGFGLPALEAMACGTPVICSDRGALPEVVDDAAVVVPIGPPETLAEAIAALLGNRKRREALVDRGLRRSGRFTWRRHADAVLQAYAEAGVDTE